MSIDRADLPAVTVNTPYTQTVAMAASGGTPPYLYACTVSGGTGLSAGVTPAGPTDGGVSCVISGTPLAAGELTINFSVTDGTGASADAGFLSINVSTSADPLANWHWRNPLPEEMQNLVAVTYGNGTFVIISNSLSGDTWMIRSSTDGVTWTERATGTNRRLSGITYGNDTFVAVGEAGTILTSTEGVTWTSRYSGTINSLSGVTHGNGIFVAVGQAGTILTSIDGITWNATTAGYSFSSPTHGNGAFVAVGPSPIGAGFSIFTSNDDGLTWARTFTQEACIGPIGCAWIFIRGVTYGNGILLALPDWGPFLTSADGQTWTIVHHIPDSAGTSYLHAVAYGDGAFVGVGKEGRIVTADADDVTTWTTRASGTSIDLNGVTYGNGTFVAVGDNGAIIQSDPLE
ncbi:MAG: hypothetical protein IH628_14385 [Proteobacteria bacterium]|nr:hypothetical protein [Pseudomonadota bacterium]